MKKFMSIFLLSFIFIQACKDEDATPTGPVNDSFNTTGATSLKMGTLMGVGHTVSGKATIYESTEGRAVVLEPFSSENGPDLKVYLSETIDASSYIRLGALKSTQGKQSYHIPNNVDIAAYKYVHIWCEKFSVEFGRAALQ
jgi:hypothetical protein